MQKSIFYFLNTLPVQKKIHELFVSPPIRRNVFLTPRGINKGVPTFEPNRANQMNCDHFSSYFLAKLINSLELVMSLLI